MKQRVKENWRPKCIQVQKTFFPKLNVLKMQPKVGRIKGMKRRLVVLENESCLDFSDGMHVRMYVGACWNGSGSIRFGTFNTWSQDFLPCLCRSCQAIKWEITKAGKFRCVRAVKVNLVTPTVPGRHYSCPIVNVFVCVWHWSRLIDIIIRKVIVYMIKVNSSSMTASCNRHSPHFTRPRYCSSSWTCLNFYTSYVAVWSFVSLF